MSRLRFGAVERRFGRRAVLRSIDLEVQEGERVLVLGPNGAGKTTLLRLAAGLLRPTAGQVTASGHDTTAPAGRRRMGFVAQDAPTYAELTVHEHLQWWGRVHGIDVEPAAWTDEAGLRRLTHEPCSSLSRGQRQRLAIAMALSIDPTLLLLDEPTTALDAAGRAWLEGLLCRTRAAVVMATHDEGWAEVLGARVVRIDRGTLSEGAAGVQGPGRGGSA